MDPSQTAAEIPGENDVEKSENGEKSDAKCEPKQTANPVEQVLGVSGVRKRRNLIRRRSSSLSKQRELTPLRDARLNQSSDEDEVRMARPKTPERRRRRIKKTSSDITPKTLASVNLNEGNDEKTNVGNVDEKVEEKKDEMPSKSEEEAKVSTEDVIRNVEVLIDEKNTEITPIDSAKTSSTTTEEHATTRIDKIENLINVSQTEFISMLDKAKQKIKSSRDRYNKIKNNQKRSQSVPRDLTDEELLESFRKAQKQSAQREIQRKRESSTSRKYSTDSVKSTSSAEQKTIAPAKPCRRQAPPKPQISHLKRKPLCKQYSSNKIVEILDPKTSKVIKTKQVINITMEWRDIVTIYKYFKFKEIVNEYRKFKIDMIEEYNRIQTLKRKCFCELVILMVICGLGGVIFKFVEGAFENFYKCGVKRVKRDFIDLLWIKSHNLREEDWKSLARNRLRVFEEELHTAHEAGVHTYTGQRSWSFLNGVIYSITVVSTIGYGHLYPITTLGKGLTILYALIGIPLFLIILTDFGKLFTRCIKYVWAFFRRLCYTGRCRRVRKTTHVEEIFKGAQIVYDIAHLRRPSAFEPNVKVDDPEAGTGSPGTPAPSNFEIDDQFNLPISLALFLLVSYIILGAVAFNWLEGWSFFTSFYFVFISMSTIGFGDFVPEHHTFMIFTIVYLVFGLALMSMCINVVQDKLSDTFKQASAKLGATLGVSVNDEDGSIATVPPEAVEMPEVHNIDTGSLKTPSANAV
ncbi:hypothetical protein Trydic_g3690 [Trypoxylus dichotomus]